MTRPVITKWYTLINSKFPYGVRVFIVKDKGDTK